MDCPQCGIDNPEDAERCTKCDAALTEAVEDHAAVEYVEVIETSNPAVIPVIKSLFEGAGIPFGIEGEDLMNLFPSEMLGGIYKPEAEVKFSVPVDRAEEARTLLDSHAEDFGEL